MSAKIPPPVVTRIPRHSFRWTLELLWNFALQRIHLRYKETFLGFGWILFQPVALTVIFNYIRRVATISSGNIPYSLFAAVGLVGWSFTSLAISQSMPSLVTDAALLRRIALPKATFPLSCVLSTVVDLLVMLILVGGLFFYYRFPLHPTALWAPLIFLIQFVFLLGLGCLAALANVLLRDVGHAIPHLLWLWFFASPIFYPASMVPAEFKTLARWNPMVGFLESYRSVILLGQPPPMHWFGPTLLVTALTCSLAVAAFRRMKGTLVDLL